MQIRVNLTAEEVLVQYRTIIKQRDELLDACKLALEHLKYCNYGDKWEKECAIESGLPEKLHNCHPTRIKRRLKSRNGRFSYSEDLNPKQDRWTQLEFQKTNKLHGNTENYTYRRNRGFG